MAGDILSQVGIRVTANTRQAVEAFRQLENAEKKVGEASAFIGKISASVDKVMIPLLGLQTAFLAVNTAVQLASSAVKIWNDLWEEGEWDGTQFEQAVNTFKRLEDAAKGGAQWMDSFWAVANKLAVLEMDTATVTKGIIARLTELGRVAPNLAYLSGQFGKAMEAAARAEAAALAESEAQAEAHADFVKRVQDEREARLKREAEAAKKRYEALEDERDALAGIAAHLASIKSMGVSASELRDIALAEIELRNARTDNTASTFEIGFRDLPSSGARDQIEASYESRQSQIYDAQGNRLREASGLMDEVMAKIADRTHYAGAAYGALSDGIAAGVDAAITGSESIGKAMARAAAMSLKATATEAAVKALWETAQGTAALALGPVGGVSAAAHFKAAGIYAATAVAAGVASSALGSASGAFAGGGAGASSSAGGGYIGPRQTGGDGGTQVTIIVQGDVNDGNALAEKVERATRRAVASGRVRGGQGGQMVERV